MAQYRVEAIFSLIDKVSEPMSRMAKSMKTLDVGLAKVTGVIGALGSAAGIAFAGLGLRSILRDSEQWYEQIEKLNRELGTTSKESSSLMGTFALTDSGVQALTGHTRSWMMNIKGVTELGEDMAQSMTRVKKANPWEQLKDKSATGALLEIADKVAKSSQPLLTAATYYRRGIAQEMLPALQLGRKGLQDLMKEAQKAGVVINEQMLGQFAKFKDAKRALDLTWTGFKVQLSTAVMPLMKQMIDMFRPKLISAIEGIKPATAWFAEHLDKILATVKGIAYYMAINKGLMMVTGTGAMGWAGRAAASVGAPIGAAVGGIRGGYGMDVAFAGKGMADLRAAQTILLGIGRAGLQLLKIGGVTFILAAVVEGVLAFKDNLHGIRDTLYETGGRLADTLRRVWSQIDAFVSGIFGGESGGLTWWLKSLYTDFQLAVPRIVNLGMEIIESMGQVFETIMIHARAVQGFISELLRTGSIVSARTAYEATLESAARESAEMKAGQAAERALGKVRGTGLAGLGGAEDMLGWVKGMRGRKIEPKGPLIHNDYRGSTFQIKQDFRDQDPDRVAVVFQEDLQKLALDRVTSNVQNLSFAAQTNW